MNPNDVFNALNRFPMADSDWFAERGIVAVSMKRYPIGWRDLEVFAVECTSLGQKYKEPIYCAASEYHVYAFATPIGLVMKVLNEEAHS